MNLNFHSMHSRKPARSLEYVINETDIYDEVDVVRKLFSFREQNLNKGGNKYSKCIIGNATNRERSLNIFGDQLIGKVKGNSACKLTDLKLVLGSNQRRVTYNFINYLY